MEKYKGFFIDSDLSDHNVTVTGSITDVPIKETVFRNTAQAKAFIDGIYVALIIITKKLKQ